MNSDDSDEGEEPAEGKSIKSQLLHGHTHTQGKCI